MAFPPAHHPSITKERLEKALSPEYLRGADTNLFDIRYSPIRIVPVSMQAFAVPFGGDDPEAGYAPESAPTVPHDTECAAAHTARSLRPSFEQVVPRALRDNAFVPVAIGHTFGPSWSTHWLKIELELPKPMRGDPDVHFLFDSNCEAMIYSASGEPLQGLTGGDARTYRSNRRAECPLDPALHATRFTLFVEVAGNGLFGCGADGMINAPNPARTFNLAQCELGVLDGPANALFWDFVVLRDLVEHAPTGSFIAERALVVANQMLNVVDKTRPETLAAARALAAPLLRGLQSSSSSAASAFAALDGDATIQTVCAVGHCHIDSAWLWPFAETQRKVVRSWVTQLSYMQKVSSDFVFAASQAAQYKWLADAVPSAMPLLREMVAEGRFVPVGGTWVEPDANIPSGEAMVRQFLYGIQYMSAQLGAELAAAERVKAVRAGAVAPKRIPHGDGVFWLPDTFGYNAQLPQIVRGCGMRYFLTQKLSWSLLNKPEHNTFWWEGLDGSHVLTHFPPADDYNAQANVRDVLKSASGNKDKGRSPHSLMLYGNGDGGGGPNLPMFEQLQRMHAAPLAHPTSTTLAGMPRVRHSTPREFFDLLASDLSVCDAVAWSGELFLELHQGTLTSQASTKLGNRRSEIALHEAEFTAAALAMCEFGTSALTTKPAPYPYDDLIKLWHDVLLCQFHDVLPGSSIQLVYEDAARVYASVLEGAARLANHARSAIQALRCNAESSSSTGIVRESACNQVFRVWNTTPVSAARLVRLPFEGGGALLCEVALPSYGYVDVDARAVASSSRLTQLVDVGEGPSSGPPTALPFAEVPPFAPAGGMRVLLAHMERVSSVTGAVSLGPCWVVDNGLLRVSVQASTGHVVSLLDYRSGSGRPREVIGQHPDGSIAVGNRFILFSDVPWFWDAWDVFPYHLEKGSIVGEVDGDRCVSLVEVGPLRCTLRLKLCSFGTGSSLAQDIVVSLNSPCVVFDTTVHWAESHKVLKVDFPLALRSPTATFECQFGCVERPTHTNTSRDIMQFEVCGHRYASLSQPDYGVALLNDCKYGYTARGNRLMLTLLRAPKAPDATCDMGTHRFRYGLWPHEGHVRVNDVTQAAIAFNTQPVVEALSGEAGGMDEGVSPPVSFFRLTGLGTRKAHCSIILDTVKMAEDRSGRFIVRLYESQGHTGSATLCCLLPISSCQVVNLVEEELHAQGLAVTPDEGEGGHCDLLDCAPPAVKLAFSKHNGPAAPDAVLGSAGTVEVSLGPFQILTLRLSFS